MISVQAAPAGYMLVFRYRVVDAERAAPVFERRLKPVLVDEETGARFMVPAPEKAGPLRNSSVPQEGRTYWMAFGNPGRWPLRVESQGGREPRGRGADGWRR